MTCVFVFGVNVYLFFKVDICVVCYIRLVFISGVV